MATKGSAEAKEDFDERVKYLEAKFRGGPNAKPKVRGSLSKPKVFIYLFPHETAITKCIFQMQMVWSLCKHQGFYGQLKLLNKL